MASTDQTYGIVVSASSVFAGYDLDLSQSNVAWPLLKVTDCPSVTLSDTIIQNNQAAKGLFEIAQGNAATMTVILQNLLFDGNDGKSLRSNRSYFSLSSH